MRGFIWWFYAVIKRFDSLREITTSLLADTHKLAHIGITFKIGRSTLADANRRRPQAIFEAVYRDLYARYRHELISDSRRRTHPKWMDKLQIIDSTTITLFSNYWCPIKKIISLHKQFLHTFGDSILFCHFWRVIMPKKLQISYAFGLFLLCF